MMPIAALPRNHATPNPVSNTPKASLRLSLETIFAKTALSRESCAPIPMPHSIMPMRARIKFPKNTSGAKNAPTKRAASKLRKPTLSSNLPKKRELTPAIPIAIAYRSGIHGTGTLAVF